MKLSFRPMLGLTIVTVIALAILIALGTWQYQRLQWKTALLAEIEQVADAPPFASLAQVQEALGKGEPIDFRRIGFNGDYVEGESFHMFSSANYDISWRVFSPVSEGGAVVFAALETISNDEHEKGMSSQASGPIALNGYVRLARPDQSHTDSSPEKNRWFAFNALPETHNWADGIKADTDMRFYVDAVLGAGDAKALPARRPDIRNNHFDYMLTWYGLALTLLVIYLIMHKRAGRLSFR